MKLKEFIILAVVIVLLGTYLFLRSSDRSQYILPSVSDISTDEISRIEIASIGNTIEISRSGDQWRIGDKLFPADETKIKNILKELETLKLSDLVSEAKSYARYDLSDEKKISVKAWAGDQLVRDIEIGKAAETYQHTFVRLGDDPNVYHARNNFRQTFDQTIPSLRDKTALSFDATEINKIQIASGENHLVLTLESPEEKKASEGEAPIEATDPPPPEKPAPVWLDENGQPAPEDTVRRLLSQLAHLTCDGYLKDDQTDGLDTPVRTITLTGDETYSLAIFEKQDSGTVYPATSNQNNYPFTLSDSTWTRLTESLDSLFGTEEDS